MTAQAMPAEDPLPPYEVNDGKLDRLLVWIFIIVPFACLIVSIPLGWGGWIGWHEVALVTFFYWLTNTGIGVGNHRYFTHGSFETNRAVKIFLAVAGSLALEGPVIRWVADHRKHHKFSDRDGDPHSPWRYGTGLKNIAKGFLYAHVGWLFGPDRADPNQYAPDMLKDSDMRRISLNFKWFVVASLLLPVLIGGLWGMSWRGAILAFFWNLVRIALMHHVTFAINSVCHMVGDKPFESRDKSGNVWWLAVLSQGESYHNTHHSDPTLARHGAEKWQLDANARFIWVLEKLRLAWDVRWPVKERLDKKRRIQTA